MTTVAKTATPDAEGGPATSLKNLLESRKDQLALLVPKHLTPERLIRVAVNCVAKTPALKECSVSSLYSSVLQAAELGLEPGGALAHAALVPFKGVCTLQVMYKGWQHLLRQSGSVAGIRAVIVNAKDRFKFVQGDEPCIKHKPCLDVDPGPMVRVYCIVTFKDGFKQREVMSKAQVDKIRAASQGKDGPMWVNHYDEAAKKTVFKRLVKWLDLDTEELQKAAEYDHQDYIDGEVVSHHTMAALPEETATQKAKAAVKRRLEMVDAAEDAKVAPVGDEEAAAIRAQEAQAAP